MFWNVVGNLLNSIWLLVKWPIIAFASIIIITILIYVLAVLYYKLIEKLKTSGTEHYYVEKENPIKVVIFGLIKAAKDYCTRNIEFLPEKNTGLYAVIGMPGTGKSTTAVWDTSMLKKEFPKMKIYTNMDVKFQDGEISNWKQVMEYNNAEYGQTYILDEIGSLLNSRNFKDFPPDMLDLITQSRKVRTRILYTAQDFKFVDINIRRLTKEIWQPITYMKTICFVLRYRPIMDADGNLEKKKFIGMKLYRQDDFIRDSFDTRKQIAILKRDGFVPRSEQIRPENEIKKLSLETKKKK